jgi:hypothetical protein
MEYILNLRIIMCLYTKILVNNQALHPLKHNIQNFASIKEVTTLQRGAHTPHICL